MTHNLEVYRKVINFLMNLEEALTPEEREELHNILSQARDALPKELLQSLEEIALELYQAIDSDEDGTTSSYLRDL